MDDLISRQAAIETLNFDAELLRRALDNTDFVGIERAKYEWGLGLIESFIYDMEELPSAQPEIIRCKDCRWWDRRADGSPMGYCHACKHGHYSRHWEISIIRTYEENFFCADAERRTDE